MRASIHSDLQRLAPDELHNHLGASASQPCGLDIDDDIDKCAYILVCVCM